MRWCEEDNKLERLCVWGISSEMEITIEVNELIWEEILRFLWREGWVLEGFTRKLKTKVTRKVYQRINTWTKHRFETAKWIK